MCGRSSLHDARVSVLAKFHSSPVLPGFVPRFNIAPSQKQWTILLDDAGRPVARQLKWGLVPSWAEDPSVGQRMINARADSVTSKPSYKASFKQRRCLILADGTCTIITTNASAKAAAYHHRMPALLTLDAAIEWLDTASTEGRLLELLAPCENPDLECHEVRTLANATSSDSADCIAPFERPRVMKELTLFDM